MKLLLCVLSLLPLSFADIDPDDIPKADLTTLKFVHAIWRHGDRSPTHTFPTDTNTESTWPQGWGELSEVGMKQAYEQGQFIRGRYDGFIGRGYNSRQIYIRSDQFNRTLMTAAAVANGLYQPIYANESFIEGTTWFPVPVHEVPEDPAIWPTRHCPTFTEDFEENVLQSKEVLAFDSEYEDFLRELQGYTGFSESQLNNTNAIWDVWDPLHAEDAQTRPPATPRKC